MVEDLNYFFLIWHLTGNFDDFLPRDMFIDVHMRAKKMVTLSQLSFIFDCDEWLTVSECVCLKKIIQSMLRVL